VALKKYKTNWKKWTFVALAIVACTVLALVTKGVAFFALPVLYSKIAMIGSASVASASATKAIDEPTKKKVKREKGKRRSPSTTPCPSSPHPEPNDEHDLDVNKSMLVDADLLHEDEIKTMAVRTSMNPRLFKNVEDSGSDSSTNSDASTNSSGSTQLSPSSFSSQDDPPCFPAFK